MTYCNIQITFHGVPLRAQNIVVPYVEYLFFFSNGMHTIETRKFTTPCTIRRRRWFRSFSILFDDLFFPIVTHVEKPFAIPATCFSLSISLSFSLFLSLILLLEFLRNRLREALILSQAELTLAL